MLKTKTFEIIQNLKRLIYLCLCNDFFCSHTQTTTPHPDIWDYQFGSQSMSLSIILENMSFSDFREAFTMYDDKGHSYCVHISKTEFFCFWITIKIRIKNVSSKNHKWWPPRLITIFWHFPARRKSLFTLN